MLNKIDSSPASYNNLKSLKNYWDQRYLVGDFSWLDQHGIILYKSVASLCNHFHCQSILDIGCWHGNLIPFLKSTHIKDYFAIEISQKALTVSKKIKTKFKKKFFMGDFRLFPKISKSIEVNNLKIDCIYFGGVLAYVNNKNNARFKLLLNFKKLIQPKIVIIQNAEPWRDLDLTRDIINNNHFKKNFKIIKNKIIKIKSKSYSQRRFLVLKPLY